MAALVNFTAVQSRKYLRITDKFPTVSHSDGGLVEIGAVFPFKVETYDGETGTVKVEVSRDGTNFVSHDDEMQVVHEELYPIDDSKLPVPPPETKTQQSPT
ncbi:hypothetical protein [Mesorhizobium sp. L48C026A00]|uniref:hypothetical protein n=1 Tax=Mesorhizobium sp. L48C026A00 TaxID=1287182 RepID=UPI0003CFFA0B|nr:hypothetical protein [Mesorhizobium sp. L48C026A00]ESZ22327.1 hypothetical protein X737_02805 [Mesorhizobium sp. L48C026A00]